MLRACVSVCLFTVLAVFSSTSAMAQTFEQRTYFTFSQPVALPGVTLPAGKYMFRLADPMSSAKVVQVVNADTNRHVAMLMTLPVTSESTPEKPEVRFTETRAGVPHALGAWWYPGQSVGRGFLYPRHQ